MKTRAITAALVLFSGILSAATLKLSENGKPLADIVIDPKADRAARFAAMELQHHLKQITGGEFRIVTPDKTSGNKAIYVGGSEPVRRMGIQPEKLSEQEYVIDFRDNAVILAGKDKPDSVIPSVRYDGINTASGANWPSMYDEQGSMYAVYDFLRDYCKVNWLDSTDSGTVIVPDRDLTVTGEKSIRKPFMAYRGGTFDWSYCPELWINNSPGWLNYRKTAYPAAYAKEKDTNRANQLVAQQQRLFLLRMKAGGSYMPANHSLYNYYERFLLKNHKNFEAFKPQYFAMGLEKSKSGDEFILSSYDGKKEPPQLCYSNPETVAQVVKDIRDYFDHGGYHKKYRNISKLGYIWGKDSFCVEAMDNSGYCQCPDCRKDYEPARKEEHSEHSTYWFKFINKVADEIRKSHPDKKITTLAYGTREGLPSNLKIADNVVVYFCLSFNRMPYRKELDHQLNRLKEWRNAYPDATFALWLYNTFPQERTVRPGVFNCFPGFFAKEVERQYNIFGKLNIRGGIFHCGFIDDFENYLNLRYMCDPYLKLGNLKDAYFASYGKAEKNIRAFYDLVESRYCDPANYPKTAIHQTELFAWGCLGTEKVMNQLGQYMADAEKEADTPDAKARVANWKAGYWDYMEAGNKKVQTIPSDQKGVSVTKTCYMGRYPDAFGNSILAGKTIGVKADNCLMIRYRKAFPLKDGFLTFTDGKFEGESFLNGKAANALYSCKMPVEKLKRLRITVNSAGAERGKVVFTPVGLIDGKWVPIAPQVVQDKWYNWSRISPDAVFYTTYDFEFSPGSLSGKLDGLGILDETPSRKWNWPCYAQIEAE